MLTSLGTLPASEQQDLSYIFLVIVINNVYFCISTSKNFSSYIDHIEQHYHNIVIHTAIIIAVIVNYNFSLGTSSLSLGIIYFANILVNIIIITSSCNIKETTYLGYIQYIIIYTITSSNNIKETTYLDYIQYIAIDIITSNSNSKETIYLDYIQYITIDIITSNSNSKETIYLDYIHYLIIYIITSSKLNRGDRLLRLYSAQHHHCCLRQQHH